jgi:hypothetical protein
MEGNVFWTTNWIFLYTFFNRRSFKHYLRASFANCWNTQVYCNRYTHFRNSSLCLLEVFICHACCRWQVELISRYSVRLLPFGDMRGHSCHCSENTGRMYTDNILILFLSQWCYYYYYYNKCQPFLTTVTSTQQYEQLIERSERKDDGWSNGRHKMTAYLEIWLFKRLPVCTATKENYQSFLTGA